MEISVLFEELSVPSGRNMAKKVEGYMAGYISMYRELSLV